MTVGLPRSQNARALGDPFPALRRDSAPRADRAAPRALEDVLVKPEARAPTKALAPRAISAPAIPASDPRFQSLPAAQKRAILWREVTATPYQQLPELGSEGLGGGTNGFERLTSVLGIFRLGFLEKAFATESDVRPPREKLFHPFGTVAQVAFEPLPGSPYTGVFASGATGLARLSLATDDKSYTPGIGLKLLVDGAPSLNVHAIPSLEPQASHDFFGGAPTNVIPEPKGLMLRFLNFVASLVANPLKRPVDHLAAVDQSGKAVAAPRSPSQIRFEPAAVHFDPSSKDDFRTQLAGVPPGTVIYRVFGSDQDGGPMIPIGELRTQSPFVASSFGDHELHLQHAR